MPSDFLEKTLETIIYENRYRIHQRGFPKFYFCTKRQFSLPSGKRVDIFTWELKGDTIYCRIIELKKDKTCADALWQALEYHDEIVMMLITHFQDFQVEVVLVGDDISENLQSLAWMTPKIFMYKYNYAFDGIFFTREASYLDDAKEESKALGGDIAVSCIGKDFSLLLRETIYKKQELHELNPSIAEIQKFQNLKDN